jgi:septal ring factor EnvC (AmiA/AmiB activator)
MDTPKAPDSVEARLAQLETRMSRVERRLAESQLMVAHKLVEVFATLKKHQELRDAQVQQALTRLLEQVTQLKLHMEPVVTPTLTH